MTETAHNEPSGSLHCYTPFPWIHGAGGFDGDDPYLNVYSGDEYGPIVASVLSEEVGIDAANENAKLISAIPELMDLVTRAYLTLGRPHWDIGQTDVELSEAINDRMSDLLGNDDWQSRVDAFGG